MFQTHDEERAVLDAFLASPACPSLIEPLDRAWRLVTPAPSNPDLAMTFCKCPSEGHNGWQGLGMPSYTFYHTNRWFRIWLGQCRRCENGYWSYDASKD